MNKKTNKLIWILQIILALYNLAGGLYMINNYEKIASVWAWRALTQPFWITLGLLQVLFAIGLILPNKTKLLKKLTPISAVCLVIITLFGIVLYDAYGKFPGILWALIPALLMAFVAYKKWK